VKKWALTKHSKPTFTGRPNSLHIVLATTIISKTVPIQSMSLPKFRVRRQNPPARSASPKANRARDKATPRVANSWCFSRPHRGDLTSSSFVSESRLGGFRHVMSPPPSGLASSCLSSPNRDYSGMMRETTRPGFPPGGHLPLSGPMEGYICPCWLSPTNGDLGST
jgi:hypothetical protein